VREAIRGHPVLASVYVLLAAAVLGVVSTGGSLSSLSVYGSQFSGVFPSGTAGAITGHAADLAFGMGILPFVVGSAWLFANAVRRPATPELHAFACLGAVAVIVVLWLISAWDLHL